MKVSLQDQFTRQFEIIHPLHHRISRIAGISILQHLKICQSLKFDVPD